MFNKNFLREPCTYKSNTERDFLWGALVGGTVATLTTLFFTTQQGKKLQNRILNAYGELESCAKEKFSEAEDCCSDAKAEAKEKFSEYKDKAKEVGKNVEAKAENFGKKAAQLLEK